MFKPELIRKDFPVLTNQKNLIYFDSACTTLKPKAVIDAMNQYYEFYSACHGRSVHKLSNRTTQEFESARAKVAKFIGAKPNEIIFTKNCTEAINLVAYSLDLKQGDVVINSDREHSSNIVPWLNLQKTKGIVRKYVPSNEDEEFSLDIFKKMLTRDVKLVSVVHASNLDGYTLPVKEIIKLAHQNGSLVLLDGAQSVPHQDIDVKKLDVEFLAFSAHKMLGPTGIGALYGKAELLKKLKPFILGGETVKNTTYDSFELEDVPHRFEAGIQNYAGAIGFGAAVDYLQKIGLNNVHEHEVKLTEHLDKGLRMIQGIRILGVQDPKKRGGVTSFTVEGLDHHDIALMLDEISNIATRSGQHCLHSWFNARHIKGSVRVSLYLYNALEEVDKFLDTLRKIVQTLK